MTEQRVDGVSRRTIMAAAWAAPVVAVASATPALAASPEPATLTWAPNPTLFGATNTLVVTIPAASTYVGMSAILNVTNESGLAWVHTISASWPPFFNESQTPIQTYVPPGTILSAGTFTFEVQLAQTGFSPSAVYRATLADASNNNPLASADPLIVQ